MIRRWIPWIGVGVLWMLFLILVLDIYLTHPDGAGDYDYYWRGAQRLIQGVPLYANMTSADYNYPPLLAGLIAPVIARVNQQTAQILWHAFNAGLMLVTLALLSRHIPTRKGRLILWCCSLVFMPVIMSLWLGQITIVLFALPVGAWVAYKEHKPELTGVLLALAVWTKFYPGLVILYFLWKRDWRVVISAAVATLAVVVFQIAVVGLDSFVYYFVHVLPPLFSTGQPAINHSNNAVLGFAQKMFSESPQIQSVLDSPLLMQVTRFGLTFTILGVSLYLIRRPVTLKDTSSEQFDLEYAIVQLGALLLGSTLGIHAMLPVLLVWVILLRNPRLLPRYLRQRIKLWSFAAAILINIHMFIILGYLQPPSDHVLPALALSLPFFGMMIVWGMTVMALYRITRPERQEFSLIRQQA